MLLFMLFGSLLLRFAARMLLLLLFHEPPRTTRKFGNIPRNPVGLRSFEHIRINLVHLSHERQIFVVVSLFLIPLSKTGERH